MTRKSFRNGTNSNGRKLPNFTRDTGQERRLI